MTFVNIIFTMNVLRISVYMHYLLIVFLMEIIFMLFLL